VDHRRLAALDFFPAARRVFPRSSRPSIEPVSSRESCRSAAMRLADFLALVTIHSQSAM
jgi:hypothetical protein